MFYTCTVICPQFFHYISSDQSNFTFGNSNNKENDSWSDDLLITIKQRCNTSTTDTGFNITPATAHILNASIQLPGEVFANLTEDNGLLYSVYLTSSLFPIDPELWHEGFTVSSPVVSVTVSGKNISNLLSPIVITLPITSVKVLS